MGSPMTNGLVFVTFVLIHLQSFVVVSLPFHPMSIDKLETRMLNVGEELENESLPLQMGQRLYQLQGLKESLWYEVKISYPASIPTSFSLHLTRDINELPLRRNRRLLNTEKLIFKAAFNEMGASNLGMYVLVTADPAGIVAIRGVKDRELVHFNIVCDELSFGIPHKAWWVGIAALFCLVLASFIPCILPSNLLLMDPASESTNRKTS